MHGKVPEYSAAPLILQSVAGSGCDLHYGLTEVWVCHTCGLLAADQIAHTRFHQDLHRNACRG